MAKKKQVGNTDMEFTQAPEAVSFDDTQINDGASGGKTEQILIPDIDQCDKANDVSVDTPTSESNKSGPVNSPSLVSRPLLTALTQARTLNLSDFAEFVSELTTLSKLYTEAKSISAARRHALMILLLIQEKLG